MMSTMTHTKQRKRRKRYDAEVERTQVYPDDIPRGLEHRRVDNATAEQAQARIDNATAEQVREYIDTSMRLLQLDSDTALYYAPFGAAPHERNY